MHIFKGAVEVWDYSYANIDLLRSFGLNAHLMMVGYHDSIKKSIDSKQDETIIENSNKTNVVFVGVVNQFRYNRIHKIKYFLLESTRFEYRKSSGRFVSQDKIALNLHYYEGKTILETHRISEYLASKLVVLSEKSQDFELDNLFSPMVIYFKDRADLERKFIELSSLSDQELEAKGIAAYEKFKAMPRFGEYFDKSTSILKSFDHRE